ncbi:hypothetical protein FVEG_07550 [Fusarium verticillioides 7600]|uniref:Uncharacterized protein n=1 Tax=Gibberella moniliformis (strain M3125 / FGSC 7600) TaxID=334819 RepID=W7MSC2_GIBM7|nr:hypothetical protein FVEG_07550 [Fusarium verticillioides 7600]EWG47452.1 hypothetical protein FVEG_07550 [Fusarium verticillioides 7600]
MSLWGLRFHHTAKMPETVRKKAVRDGYKQLDSLVTLRDRAIVFASSEADTDGDEAGSDSWEHGSDGDIEATTEHESDQEEENDGEDPWEAQAAASAAAVEEEDAADSQGDTGSEENAGNTNLSDAETAVDENFNHHMKVLAAALSGASAPAQDFPVDTTAAESSGTTNQFLTNDPGSSEEGSSQSLGQAMDVDSRSTVSTEGTDIEGNPEGTNSEGTGTDGNPGGNSPESEWLTNTPGSPYYNGVASSPNNANSSSQAGEATVTQQDGEADANSVGEVDDQPFEPNDIHVPVYRRPSTLFDTPPTWADQYKKFFDKAFAVWCVFYNTSAPRPLRQRLRDQDTHEAAVKRYNLINLGLYPCVTAEHLLELKLRIDDAARFCDFLTANMLEIDHAKDQRKEVIYTYPANSPLRLRTKGLGSSLRYATHVDEGWDDLEDNWGMPPIPKKRSLIQSHASEKMSW